MSHNTSEYKVIADKIVSPDEDIIIHVAGDVYKGSIEEQNRYTTVSDLNGGGGGPLVIPFAMKDTNGDDLLAFEKGGTGVTRIHAVQDDLALRSARDIILYPGDDGPGNVYIGWGDATIAPNATNKVATIADVEAATGLGNFTFDASTASVDGNQTIYLKALNNTNDVDAQLVLDPDNNAAKIEAYGFEGTSTFVDSQGAWAEATWNTDGNISFYDCAQILSYINVVADVVARVKVFVNETFVGYYAGTSLGNPVGGLTMNLSGGPTPPAEPVTITQVDFISAFKSKIEVNYDNNAVLIEGKDLDVRISSDDDVFIEATGDDVFVRANDDIRFTSNWMNDAEEPEYYWRMNSEGRLTFPGDGYIENPPMSDSETSSKSTFIINPDVTTGNDQYLIVEPTTGNPTNHIHIRAGGAVDNSTADLILGGEKNNVVISDTSRDVFINTRPDQIINTYTNLNEVNNTNFIVDSTANIEIGYKVNVGGTDCTVDSVTPDSGLKLVTALSNAGQATFTAGQSYTFTYNPEYTNSWQFDSNGTLYGPAMGGLIVTGIAGQNDSTLNIWSDESMTLTANGGDMNFYMDGAAYIGPSQPSGRILTQQDLNNIPVKTLPPETASSQGTTGQISWDSNYIYVCVATDTWKRVALSTW